MWLSPNLPRCTPSTAKAQASTLSLKHTDNTLFGDVCLEVPLAVSTGRPLK